ncbi:hypothetical protein PV703_19450 [Streptomyces sp. ME01-24h]|nr:hypothetical protein [Streptomyces sp. ME19-03-3]MDX3355441.1 hypothetical protein [Streptomyces sp. ME01-24h]
MSTSLREAPGVLVEFESPDVFHEIPLHLPPDAFDAQVSELAARIWPGGTDFQREATAAVYREVAGSLDADGVLHAALGLFATEDDRISTANLLVRIEEIDPGDPGMAATALHELLSLEPHRDVHKVDLDCGPAVVSFHATAVDGEQVAEPFAFLHIELYVPSPFGGYLVVFSLSTPSLADLPVYVALMSEIGESVHFARDRGASGGVPEGSPEQPSAGGDARSVFG